MAGWACNTYTQFIYSHRIGVNSRTLRTLGPVGSDHGWSRRLLWCLYATRTANGTESTDRQQ